MVVVGDTLDMPGLADTGRILIRVIKFSVNLPLEHRIRS